MAQRRQEPVPTAFVYELMNAGWNRKDADALELVQQALLRADDPRVVRTQAQRVATALRREPVLAGTIHRLAGYRDIDRAASVLSSGLPPDEAAGLIWLAMAARRQAGAGCCCGSCDASWLD